MILGLYSIKDKLTEFQGTMAIQDDKVALRIFEGYCRRQKAENYTDSRYFEIYKLGEMNTETGVINAYTKQEIKLIGEGDQYDEQRT